VGACLLADTRKLAAVSEKVHSDSESERISDFYRTEIKTEGHCYTADDAERMATFAASIFDESREGSKNLPKERTPLDGTDPFLNVVVNRGNLGERRYDTYKFEELEEPLTEQLDIVRRAARASPADMLTPPEMLSGSHRS
jgi:hypothetical protein